MRPHGCLWGLVSVVVLTAALPAYAATATTIRIDIQQSSLPRALSEFAREAKVELLYDGALVRDLKAPPVRGRMSAAQALSALLAGSGVGYRVTADGTFVLFSQPPQQAGPTGEGAVAEVLVIGHRTQNVDIQRTPDDIQAYRVTTREDLALQQNGNIGEFMRGREPANAELVQPSQDLLRQPGDTRSEFDLRGIGPRRTLVLIDGRRIPGLPTGTVDFVQGDLNGVPLGAIERIETLTSTAGGIYGPSAIGGVVNVVLRRDYRGADVSVISGLADRGDAAYFRLEGRIGFTPDHGTTDVMLFGSYAESQALQASERDYAARSRLMQLTNDPANYLAALPPTNAILVRSLGDPLRLDPQYGGTELSAGYTYLPLDFVGSDEERIAALIRNSGQIVVDPPLLHAGELGSIVSTPKVWSVLFNVRRRVSDHVEAYLDGLLLTNDGRAERPHELVPVVTAADAPGNPFDQPVVISFPALDFYDVAKNKLQISRFTAGIIASLPKDWRAAADVAVGRAGLDLSTRGISGSTLDLFFARRDGLPRPNGLPALEPFGPFEEFRAALARYGVSESLKLEVVNQFTDASARASGPLFTLPGGPVTATLSVEARREHVPTSDFLIDIPGLHLALETPVRTQSVASAYAEARVPVASEDAAVFLLRGLELQLAVRNDYVRTTFPEDAPFAGGGNDRLITVNHDATVFTAGARFLPKPWLMLRGSIATGQLPPSITQLQTRSSIIAPPTDLLPDPKRGGEFVGVVAPAVLHFGGAHDILPEEGRTVSVGAVLNPLGRNGPRVSVDFSRITTNREIVPFPLSQPRDLLAAEATYPDRVHRGPLTQADIDRGFSVGPVTLFDTTNWNAARTVVDSVDFQGDWTLSFDRLGELRVYGTATWQPGFRTQLSPGGPWIERIGYYDGPLEWRGNAGLRWTRGSLAADLNVQYFHSYRVTSVGLFADVDAGNEQSLRSQGSEWIPAQAYVDLLFRKRFRISSAEDAHGTLDVSFGVQNLFDHSPPIVAQPSGVGYSTYGDPRRRRFELILTASF